MSDRELAKSIIDMLPDYKISSLLAFLRGVAFGDEQEDDLFCEKLAENYVNNPDPHKNDYISIEDLAKREGIELI